MSEQLTQRAFSTPPRNGSGTRGVGETERERTGQGHKSRVRRTSSNNGDHQDNPVENLQNVFANVRVSGQGGHCLVQGCFYSEAAGHPGFSATEGLKAHIEDAHLIHRCQRNGCGNEVGQSALNVVGRRLLRGGVGYMRVVRMRRELERMCAMTGLGILTVGGKRGE